MKEKQLIQQKIDYSLNLIRLEQMSLEFNRAKLAKLNGTETPDPISSNEINHFNR